MKKSDLIKIKNYLLTIYDVRRLNGESTEEVEKYIQIITESLKQEKPVDYFKYIIAGAKFIEFLKFLGDFLS